MGMDGSTGIVPTMNLDGGDFGGNSFMWIFGLLILMAMFNGNFTGNNNAIGYENLSTSGEVQRGFDNQNLQAQTRDILGAVTNGTAQSVSATNEVFHNTINALSDKYGELQRDIASNAVSIANLQANQNSCCCDVKQLVQGVGAGINANIAQNKYDSAMNTASINANTTTQVQKVLDAIQQNKIEGLQAQVNELQMQNQLAGVVKYPMNTMYNIPSPCFGNCCGA